MVAIAGICLLLAINVAAYLAPIDYSGLTGFAYPGAFIVCFLANALIAIPIPYIPLIARIGASADSVVLVVAFAALGSALGESVAFVVGRAEQGLVSEHRVYRWLHRIAKRKILSGLFIFAFAVPLNPVFDVAGLAAGAVGVSFRVFFVAVLLARSIRLGFIVWAGAAWGLV
ncbi:MAG: DedA family protein [Chloroflexi bacterium]|nr:DedA family protein [Chloroflexota bacterium]